MTLDPSDIHTAISSFAGVMFAEVVVKPIAIRIGRYLIRRLDELSGDRIPNWLWVNPKHPCDK
jgi:hypothetical protein